MVAQKKSTHDTSETKPVPASSAIGVEGTLPMPVDTWKPLKKISFVVVVAWVLVIILSIVFAVA